MEIQDLIDKLVEIESYQANYVIFNVDQQRIRIDFNHKREFRLKVKTKGQLQYFANHPLLMDYNESFTTTYINSKAENVDLVSNQIKAAIEEATLGWRNWTDYVTDKRINYTLTNFKQNLRNGSGKLLEAPLTIARQVVAVCSQHQIETKLFETPSKTGLYKLILIERSYVIAENFKYKKLNG